MNGIAKQDYGFPTLKRQHKESSGSVLHEMTMHKLRQCIETLQENVASEVDSSKLDVLVDELINELNRFDMQNSKLVLVKEKNGNHNNVINRLPSVDDNHLPEIEFKARNSVLDDLFEMKQRKTIYHIFIAIFFILCLNTLIHDYVADGTINFGLRLILIGFGKLHIALFIWSILQSVSCLIYLGLNMWTKSINQPQGKQEIINKLFLGTFIICQIGIIIGTVKLVLLFDLPPASSIAILMEMTRFLMKNHAFVRSNVPKVLAAIEKKESRKVAVPSFEKFLYFMFAPTIIYRDHYPRTKYIRWNRVFWNLMEVICVIFFISFIFERFMLPYYRNFGMSSIQAHDLVSSIFGCMMPATIGFICGFYCLLHAWMNAAGEMLRFADRMFYKDWWNSYSLEVYFITWNIVVHDWLYTYIYKDIYEIVCKKSKVMSALIVFTISALFHELVLFVSFRFFYPVFFMSFEGCALLSMLIRNRRHKSLGNTFLWITIAIGNGLCVSLYCMEYFARQNCPMSSSSIWMPVSWTCNGIQSNQNYTVEMWSR